MIDVFNPSTREFLGSVPNQTAEQASDAVEHADKAFQVWSRRSSRDRANVLQQWAQKIEANATDLAVALTQEQGKPLKEAHSEITASVAAVRHAAELALRLRPDHLPTTRANTDITVDPQPLGVVAAITPWNFPVGMITRKIAPALAAGCTVVLKPAPETPLIAQRVLRLLHEVSMPDIAQLVTGDAPPIGEVFSRHAKVRIISFTGSTGVGKQLMRQAAAGVKRLTLELGGNAPFIVCNDADLKAAVDGLMQSKFRNSGQTCICANRIFVQRPILKEFLELLQAAMQRLVLGNGLNAQTTQGPLIHARALEKVDGLVQEAVSKGACCLMGGKPTHLDGLQPHFYAPTLLTDIPHKATIAHTEIFGPVAAIYPFETDVEALSRANETPSGLAGYVYTNDLEKQCFYRDGLEVGMMAINTGSLSGASIPFGGIKESGFGREGGEHGLEEFLNRKVIVKTDLLP
jgi:succinate-semialdehyde dehydrogenase / glutarate-semialdehyde dehydrogenase